MYLQIERQCALDVASAVAKIERSGGAQCSDIQDEFAETNGRYVSTNIARFLFRYRATPHTTTQVSPAELFLGRVVRTTELYNSAYAFGPGKT